MRGAKSWAIKFRNSSAFSTWQ